MRRGADDVLTALRAATATEHDRVETTLDLLDPGLTRARLAEVLQLLHGFWIAENRSLGTTVQSLRAAACWRHFVPNKAEAKTC